jgi:hypothetical protein
MNATAQTTTFHTGRRLPRAILAHQLTPQRHGYTPAILRALAPSQQGPLTTQVQHLRRDRPTPLSVRLTAATPHQLPVNIAVERPVKLPSASARQPLTMSCCDTSQVTVDRTHGCSGTCGCGHTKLASDGCPASLTRQCNPTDVRPITPGNRGHPRPEC